MVSSSTTAPQRSGTPDPQATKPSIDFDHIVNENTTVETLGQPFGLSWTLHNAPALSAFDQLHLYRIQNGGPDIPEALGNNISFVDVENGGTIGSYTLVEDLTNDVSDTNCTTVEPTECYGTAAITITEVDDFKDAPLDALYFFGLSYVGTANRASWFFYSYDFTITRSRTGASAGGPSTISSSSSTSSSSSMATASANPNNSPNAAPITTASTASTSSKGLSTGAIAGIVIGSVGFALLLIIAALLFWRRNKKRQAYAYPGGPAYNSQDFTSGERDLHAEKEGNVMSTTSSPYEAVERHSGPANIPAVVQKGGHGDQRQSQRESWIGTEQERGGNRESYHDQDVSAPPAAPTPPPAAGGVSHLHEPGMSPEELARLEEEERRLDEAIAEAERRRI